MVEIKSCKMESYGRMATSHAFDGAQTVGITCRFFFTCDVIKSKCFIFDETNGT